MRLGEVDEARLRSVEVVGAEEVDVTPGKSSHALLLALCLPSCHTHRFADATATPEAVITAAANRAGNQSTSEPAIFYARPDRDRSHGKARDSQSEVLGGVTLPRVTSCFCHSQLCGRGPYQQP